MQGENTIRFFIEATIYISYYAIFHKDLIAEALKVSNINLGKGKYTGADVYVKKWLELHGSNTEAADAILQEAKRSYDDRYRFLNDPSDAEFYNYLIDDEIANLWAIFYPKEATEYLKLPANVNFSSYSFSTLHEVTRKITYDRDTFRKIAAQSITSNEIVTNAAALDHILLMSFVLGEWVETYYQKHIAEEGQIAEGQTAEQNALRKAALRKVMDIISAALTIMKFREGGKATDAFIRDYVSEKATKLVAKNASVNSQSTARRLVEEAIAAATNPTPVPALPTRQQVDIHDSIVKGIVREALRRLHLTVHDNKIIAKAIAIINVKALELVANGMTVNTVNYDILISDALKRAKSPPRKGGRTRRNRKLKRATRRR